MLNQFKNLSITASRPKAITRKNILKLKLIKFPVRLYHVRSPENICGLINSLRDTSVFVFICSILLRINFYPKRVREGTFFIRGVRGVGRTSQNGLMYDSSQIPTQNI